MSKHRGVAASVVASAAIITIGSACFQQDVATIEDAFVVLPVGREPASLCLSAWNMSADSDTVVGVDVAIAGRSAVYRFRDHAQFSTEQNADSLSALESVSEVPFGAWQRVDFTANGLHVRLFDLRHPLVRGDSTLVTLRFKRKKPASATARIVTYAEFDSALASRTTAARVSLGGEPSSTSGAQSLASSPAARSAMEGARLFRVNGCASCHGRSGQGDGLVGASLATKPRDFRDSLAFKNGTDVASIAQTIATGIVSSGAMPRFPHLSQAERESLALFVRSILYPSPDSSSKD